MSYLVIAISRSVTGQSERGLGEGATAGHDEGGHQLVVSHVPGVRKHKM